MDHNFSVDDLVWVEVHDSWGEIRGIDENAITIELDGGDIIVIDEYEVQYTSDVFA